MLRSLKELKGRTITAVDGEVGQLVDLLLDDERWAVRYLAVDAGGLVVGRHLLLSPRCLTAPLDPAGASGTTLEISLTREQLRSSPSVDADEPITHPKESDYLRYYGYSSCWAYPGVWGVGGPPGPLSTAGHADATSAPATSHLRSATDVLGYQLEGTDGAIGHIDDFLFADESWEIRYLVIKTGSWCRAKRVLLAPHWARSIDWAERCVRIDLTREAVEQSPAWDGVSEPQREYEARLHRHFGRQAYWGVDAPAFEAARQEDAGLGPEKGVVEAAAV